MTHPETAPALPVELQPDAFGDRLGEATESLIYTNPLSLLSYIRSELRDRAVSFSIYLAGRDYLKFYRATEDTLNISGVRITIGENRWLIPSPYPVEEPAILVLFESEVRYAKKRLHESNMALKDRVNPAITIGYDFLINMLVRLGGDDLTGNIQIPPQPPLWE